MNDIKVSVIMITYNHQYFLKDAILGVLNQETDFDYEIIIADDCSEYNPYPIINSFKDHKNFNKIKFYKHKKNKGPSPNFIWCLDRCVGSYIAHCEGDDYWIDSNKLQKQVDFLDENLSFNLCFTKAYKLTEGLLNTIDVSYSFNNEYELVDLYDKNLPINICTVVFRNQKYPKWLNQKILCGDLALYTALSLNSKIKMLDFYSAVYRVHSNGVWQGMNTEKQIIARLQLYSIVFPFVNKKVKQVISNQVFMFWLRDLIYLKTLNRSKFYKIIIQFTYNLRYLKLIKSKL